MVNLLLGSEAREVSGAAVRGTDLWLPLAGLDAATGWSLKPEGFCRDEVCIPTPRGREAEFTRGGDVNVAAFWRHMGAPALHDAAGSVWMLGEPAAARAAALESLQAPDFSLPDLDGRMHALSEQRGRKVLLVTWASW